MLIQHFLEDSARKFPAKTAIIERGGKYTYEEINRMADRLARAIRAHGIRRGDRVAVFMDNSIEAVISIFGILKADAVFLILSPSLKFIKLAYILNHCEAKGLICGVEKSAELQGLSEAVPGMGFVIASGDASKVKGAFKCNVISWDDVKGGAANPVRAVNIDLDLACIIYTSGSTADPKGVMLTHRNMISAADSIIQYLGNTSEDVVLNVLPLSFDYGLYQVLMCFRFGGTLVLGKNFVYPYEVMKLIEREAVTGFPGVPTLFAILLRMDLSRFRLDSLRYITNTAAHLPVEHIARLRASFPRARVFSMYGLTECKRALYLPPEELDRRPGSVGRAIPNEEAWIVDERGEKVGPGIVGELVVRGSNVMAGYWRDETATNAVLKQGKLPGEKVLYTGDLFRMDEEGFFYFVGRKDDQIKTRGERVSPKEVESVLYRMKGISEAAVIPVPDVLLGNAIKAFITVENGSRLDEKGVILHCRRHLEDFAVPRYIEFRDDLPKNASGKIDRMVLKRECRSTLVKENVHENM